MMTMYWLYVIVPVIWAFFATKGNILYTLALTGGQLITGLFFMGGVLWVISAREVYIVFFIALFLIGFLLLTVHIMYVSEDKILFPISIWTMILYLGYSFFYEIEKGV